MNFHVSDATTRRKLVQATSSLTISYTLQSSSVSASTLTNAINQAISTGTFNQQLNTIAATNGAVGLTNAESSAPTISNTSPTSVPTVKPSSAESIVKHSPVIAIVSAIAAILVVSVCAFILYRHHLKKQVKSSIEADSNTDNSLAHRITIGNPLGFRNDESSDNKMLQTKRVSEGSVNPLNQSLMH